MWPGGVGKNIRILQCEREKLFADIQGRIPLKLKSIPEMK